MLMQKVKIENIQEYNYVKSGLKIDPLFLIDFFDFDIELRNNIQRELFGDDREKANEKYYHYIWQNKKHLCEECAKPLYAYSAVFISHILPRGSYPEIAHDVRNSNILCFEHHSQWENGKKQEMSIYRKNKIIINTLKKEYGYTYNIPEYVTR